MSSTFTTTPQRDITAPTASAGLRVDTAVPTSLEAKFTLGLNTVISTPRPTATATSIDSTTTSRADGSVGTCSVDDDCATGRTCANGKCVDTNDAALFGGSDSDSTSHLSTASAIGIGVGVATLIALVIGFGIWFWRVRGRRTPNDLMESALASHHKSASNATKWMVDNDQKTLVASFPNSPHNAGFHEQQHMSPVAFAKAVETEKTLPRPPRIENPLPPAPTDQKRYALNVNTNESMIFDEDMMKTACANRYSESPHEPLPRYRFEEYHPPVAGTPSISITVRRPASSQRSSGYELQRFPNKRHSSTDNISLERTQHLDPREVTLSELEGKPPLLPLPDLPPPSPDFSFRSYDWYQEIIGDQQKSGPPTPTLSSGDPARTSTHATFPASPSHSPRFPEVDSSLVPGPLSPSVPPHLAALNPVSIAPLSSPNPDFRLSTAVPRSPKLPLTPSVPPKARPSSPNATRVSMLSTVTHKNHNPQSGLPDNGMHIPDERKVDGWARVRRPSDPSRPTSYSPLS